MHHFVAKVYRGYCGNYLLSFAHFLTQTFYHVILLFKTISWSDQIKQGRKSIERKGWFGIRNLQII